MKKNFELLINRFETVFDLFDGQIYFVGGSVRDLLLNKPVSDIDMATPLTPDKASALLQSAGYKVIPTGLDYGTITFLMPDKTPIELTSFRKDVSCDGRRAVVAYSESMEMDSVRRDLTVNALYMGKDGQIFDFHHGQKDLKKRRIRFIGNAEDRINEDALRILRFFRFWGEFGGKKPNADTMKICRKNHRLLLNLSKERQRDELFKILSSANPTPIIRYLYRLKLWQMITDIQPNFKALKHIVSYENHLGQKANPLLRLLALTNGIVPNLKLSKKQIDFSKRLTKSMEIPINSTHQARAVLYLYGRDVMLARILMRNKKISYAAFCFYERLSLPVFPITAQDLISKGLTGAKISKAMSQMEHFWISSKFLAQKSLVLQSFFGYDDEKGDKK